MKIIEKRGLLGIDKKEIDNLIAARKFIGINRSPRAETVIVSLTSYKPRINDVKYVIYSLLNQTFPPDKLILWLDEDSFPQREKNLPRDLLNLRAFGLKIDWCENLRSYKKLIPALEKYPDEIIVTADDDIFYQPDWLKILYDDHLNYPDCVIAHSAHRIRLDAQGNLFPYRQWHQRMKPLITPPHCTVISSRAQAAYFTQRNFFTSGAGTLFKKKIFHSDILNRELFTELAPLADDIWFWAMAVLNGTKIKVPNNAMNTSLINIDIDEHLDGETLWSKNKTQNDITLQRIMDKYPEILRALIREDANYRPYLSVIVFMKGDDNLNNFYKNISTQRFSEFELIIINSGSPIENSKVLKQFPFINYPGASVDEAFGLGLQKAKGEYVLFKNMKSTFKPEALEIIAQVASDSQAEAIHFTGHDDPSNNFISDDVFNCGANSPILFNDLKQRLAMLWLENKLSKRLDTKIFRREFLIKHEINFDKGSSEFMFQALLAAERYLFVPQSFSKG